MSRQVNSNLKSMPFTDDPNAASRKKDHIELAFKSQVAKAILDERFSYEPLLSAHPCRNGLQEKSFLGKTIKTPLWVSSMTGGTQLARTINHNLGRACQEFGMGMGLGSCRQLLRSDEYFEDFNIRPMMGEDVPLFANLGIAQIEQLINTNELFLIDNLLDKLQADGLIVHVNPLQEWLQPEGDRFEHPPIETIMRLLDHARYPIIVKEVGQGFGKESLRLMLQLPLAAIDFAASGGTNFAKLELLRSDVSKMEIFQNLALVGHSAEEMVNITNDLVEELGSKVRCNQLIISGGIKSFLDGYYLMNKSNLSAVYGQASSLLRHAREDYEVLSAHISNQVRGLEVAQAFLKVK